MNFKLEICVRNIQSAVNAEKAGAHRIELCDNLWEGGTTPSAGLLEVVCDQLKIDVFSMIRPRGGDFVYSTLEFEAMKRSIKHAKLHGASGIVSGVLLSNGTIDLNRTRQLIEWTTPLPFTFHRAFDLTFDPRLALEQLIDLGAQRILTSGQKNQVVDGAKMILELNQKANGRIIIMPGGGLRSTNIQEVARATQCNEFHMTAKKYVQEHFEIGHNISLNGSNDIPEDRMAISDVETIQTTLSLLHAMD